MCILYLLQNNINTYKWGQNISMNALSIFYSIKYTMMDTAHAPYLILYKSITCEVPKQLVNRGSEDHGSLSGFYRSYAKGHKWQNTFSVSMFPYNDKRYIYLIVFHKIISYNCKLI